MHAALSGLAAGILVAAGGLLILSAVLAATSLCGCTTTGGCVSCPAPLVLNPLLVAGIASVVAGGVWWSMVGWRRLRLGY